MVLAFQVQKGGTEYGIGWIPFGGYVKIAGMIDESMDTDQMKQPVQPYEFRAKPAWQRLLIMVGGVLMNILLAVFIYIGMSYTWGKTYLDNKDVKYGYVYNDLAREMGFRNGDKIVDIDGEAVEDAGAILADDRDRPGETVTVDRDGQRVRIDIPEEAIAQLLKSPDFATVRIPFVVGETVAGGPAAQAGLLAGDTLVSFNGESMRYFDQYRQAFETYASDTVTLGVMRDSAGITRLITLPVKVSERDDRRLSGIPGQPARAEHAPVQFLAGDPGRYPADRQRDQQLRQANQTDVHTEDRSLQIAGRRDRHRQHLSELLELGTVLAHYGVPVGRAGGYEHPADPGAGRRTRIVPTGRSNHRATTER